MHVLDEVYQPYNAKTCILLHIITMTKQQTIGSPNAAPQGVGAPESDDLITIRPSDLLAGLVAEYQEYFDGFSGASLAQLEAEARWIALGGIERALLQHSRSTRMPLTGVGATQMDFRVSD
jgi:hypothetical protein